MAVWPSTITHTINPCRATRGSVRRTGDGFRSSSIPANTTAISHDGHVPSVAAIDAAFSSSEPGAVWITSSPRPPAITDEGR